MVGGAFVGSAYATIGWAGTSLLTAALAAMALGSIALLAPLAPSRASDPPKPRAPPEGVSAALRSNEFVTYGVTCFTNGWMMMQMMQMLVFVLRDEARRKI